MKRKKKIMAVILGGILLFAGCIEDNNTTLGYVTEYEEDGTTPVEPVYIPEFDAMFYDNDGNNYVTFRGNNFNITPNKVKQYGYDPAEIGHTGMKQVPL